MSGQTSQEVIKFLNSDDNKSQLLNINQGSNIKEIFVLSKANTTFLSKDLEIFFAKISDLNGIKNRKPEIHPIQLVNNDTNIKVPPPAGLIVYLTQSQLDELNRNTNIQGILDKTGKIEISDKMPDRDNKIIQNIEYEIIGRVYKEPKYQSDSYKIDNKTPKLLGTV